MRQYTCSICKGIFTRDWNLKRHIQDVHGLADYTKKSNINQGIKENDYYSPSNSNSSYKEKDMDYRNNYKKNPCYYDIFYTNFPNDGYYIHGSFPDLIFNSQTTENRELNDNDKIEIQKVLKILEDHLKKVGVPVTFVFGIITLLKRRCFSEKSDEPLKNFLITHNLGYLWPCLKSIIFLIYIFIKDK
jgi:hypothetical protein